MVNVYTLVCRAPKDVLMYSICYWYIVNLAGMYESHRNSGLGFNIVYKSMCEVAARGGKLVSTYISTNNDRAIRLHVNMDFRFEEVTYVFIKHNDECN